MVVSADGAMVPLLYGEWGEVRTLAVGEVVKRCSRCRRRTPDWAPAAAKTASPSPRAVASTPSAGTVRNQPVQPVQPVQSEIHTRYISYFPCFTSAEAFTHLAAQYHRLAARRGRKRAIVAVAHSILVSAYHMLKQHESYNDLGGNYFDERKKRTVVNRLIRRI